MEFLKLLGAFFAAFFLIMVLRAFWRRFKPVKYEHRDLFAEAELRDLRRKKQDKSHVTPKGILVIRHPPAGKVLQGDMLNHLKRGKA